MRWASFLLFAGFLLPVGAQEPPVLEAATSPFDFDNYRRTPLQARQTSDSWASRNNQELQRDLITGRKGQKQDIGAQAAALFQDPETVPTRWEPEPLPTRNELTDRITSKNYGETTKGRRDLLARGRVQDELGLATLSQSEYEILATQLSEETQLQYPKNEVAPLRPMPSLINSKTGGAPHAYSVSQAGVGVRTESRNGENPFEDVIRALRLDKPVTKGTDPLPTPSARLAVASAAAPAPVTPAESAGDTPQDAPDAVETKP